MKSLLPEYDVQAAVDAVIDMIAVCDDHNARPSFVRMSRGLWSDIREHLGLPADSTLFGLQVVHRLEDIEVS